MKKITLIFILFFLFSLLGCASEKHFLLKPNTLNQLGPAPKDVARVIFFSPTSIVSSLSTGSLIASDEDKEIGPITGKSYFVYDTNPGKHIFGVSVNRIRFDFIRADIEGGKTYYVWTSLVDSFIAGTYPRISAVKKDSEKMSKLDEWLPDLRQIEFDERGRNYLTNKKTKEKATSKLRNEKENWLAGAKNREKPKLLPEDGI